MGATSLSSRRPTIRCFNPRPVWGDTMRMRVRVSLIRFNPRPHMGGDQLRGLSFCLRAVSIHAHTWGATPSVITFVLNSEFQSTPPHGGRPPTRPKPTVARGFNPRPHMGGDAKDQFHLDCLKVSIHAPTWGATLFVLMQFLRLLGFNPRPHMGGDAALLELQIKPNVSIHAPTWGATRKGRSTVEQCGVSIHAPTWGATAHREHQGNGTAVSIHAPTWGATSFFFSVIMVF